MRSGHGFLEQDLELLELLPVIDLQSMMECHEMLSMQLLVRRLAVSSKEELSTSLVVDKTTMAIAEGVVAVDFAAMADDLVEMNPVGCIVEETHLGVAVGVVV
jgi:hypothetical protein